MKKHTKEIVSALERRHAVLFVGAGVSMSVGLPSWKTLVDHILSELRLDDSVMHDPDISYQTIAECYRLQHGTSPRCANGCGKTGASRRSASNVRNCIG